MSDILYHIDLPDPHRLVPGSPFVNVGSFHTRKEAEIFVIKHITGCYNQVLLDFFINESDYDTLNL
jgi:hypothetical protein